MKWKLIKFLSLGLVISFMSTACGKSTTSTGNSATTTVAPSDDTTPTPTEIGLLMGVITPGTANDEPGSLILSAQAKNGVGKIHYAIVLTEGATALVADDIIGATVRDNILAVGNSGDASIISAKKITGLTADVDHTAYFVVTHEDRVSDVIHSTAKTKAEARVVDFGEGTEANPWRIYTLSDLEAIGNRNNDVGETGAMWTLDAYYKLESDIDMSVDYGPDKKSWTPIGDANPATANTVFTGHFDGNGHKISGLYINPEASYFTGGSNMVGFFAGLMQVTTGTGDNVTVVNPALVENVTFENAYVSSVNNASGDRDTGVVVGLGVSGDIENVSVVNSKIVGKMRMGGIAGRARALNVRNNYVNVDIIATGTRVGGIIGYVAAEDAATAPRITDNVFVGSIVSNVAGNSDIGGVVGYTNSPFVTNNIVVAYLEANNRIGGIVGYAQSFANCDISGNIFSGSMRNYAAGNTYPIIAVRQDASLKDAEIDGTNKVIKNNYFVEGTKTNGTVLGAPEDGSVVYQTGEHITLNDVKNIQFFVENGLTHDFTNTFEMGAARPKLKDHSADEGLIIEPAVLHATLNPGTNEKTLATRLSSNNPDIIFHAAIFATEKTTVTAIDIDNAVDTETDVLYKASGAIINDNNIDALDYNTDHTLYYYYDDGETKSDVFSVVGKSQTKDILTVTPEILRGVQIGDIRISVTTNMNSRNAKVTYIVVDHDVAYDKAAITAATTNDTHVLHKGTSVASPVNENIHLDEEGGKTYYVHAFAFLDDRESTIVVGEGVSKGLSLAVPFTCDFNATGDDACGPDGGTVPGAGNNMPMKKGTSTLFTFTSSENNQGYNSGSNTYTYNGTEYEDQKWYGYSTGGAAYNHRSIQFESGDSGTLSVLMQREKPGRSYLALFKLVGETATQVNYKAIDGTDVTLLNFEIPSEGKWVLQRISKPISETVTIDSSGVFRFYSLAVSY